MRNIEIVTLLTLLLCFNVMNVYAQAYTDETNASVEKQEKDIDSIEKNNDLPSNPQNMQSTQNLQDGATIPNKNSDLIKSENGLAGQVAVSTMPQNGKDIRNPGTANNNSESKYLVTPEEEIEKLKESQNNLKNEIDKLTKAMYLNSPGFGDKYGPGYYYRFTAQKDVRKTFNNYFYIIKNSKSKGKKGKGKIPESNNQSLIRRDDFVSFELKEMLSDSTVISQTPLLTVVNNERLPDIVRAAFSVGKTGDTVIIVALAKQVYSGTEKDNLPKGVLPDTSLIYQFKLVDSRNADNNDFSVLRVKS
ncbi:hypothetical protein DV589_18495 [Salmonella enterica]|nr:hypothetical protein [Salmonella enterica]EKF0975017.1 hypothetical protein [Salmonella enterica]